jgi:hypothetical protein
VQCNCMRLKHRYISIWSKTLVPRRRLPRASTRLFTSMRRQHTRFTCAVAAHSRIILISKISFVSRWDIASDTLHFFKTLQIVPPTAVLRSVYSWSIRDINGLKLLLVLCRARFLRWASPGARQTMAYRSLAHVC